MKEGISNKQGTFYHGDGYGYREDLCDGASGEDDASEWV